MEKLKIRNWDKWQSYRRDRGQPPWIKVHRRLLRDPEWVTLSDSERGQLVAIWLLAADNDGAIPASPDLIKKLCFLTTKPDLKTFIEHGFIEEGVNTASERRQDGVPEEGRGEEDRIETDHSSVPLEKIYELYNQTLCPPLPEAQKRTDQRDRHIRARWREHPGLHNFENYFTHVKASDFLMGKVNGSKWVPDLGWLMSPENFAKVMEGCYANRR